MSSTNTYTEQKYCVYITHYSGNKMPPNYIGSSTVERVNCGYHGSVQSKKYKSIWISELKENPELFRTTIISLHDTAKESLWKELQLQKILNVVKSSSFINMSFAQPNGYFGMSDSETQSKNQSKLVSEGRHIFQGSYNNERLLSLGIHSSQNKDFNNMQKNRNNVLVKQGTHYFQSETSIENNRKMQKEFVENGTHWLLSGDIQRESSKKLLESGDHITQIKCSCIYCKKESNYLSFTKHHGDNCKLSPNYTPKEYICEHCDFKSTNKTNIDRFHNDNCKLSPNYTPKEYICEHCDKTTQSIMTFKKYHGDKCKLSPNYKPILIKCPYCNKESTSKSNMLRYHFDNCKHKPI